MSGDFAFALAVGGVGADEGLASAADGAGGTYVAGRFRGTADFDPGPASVTMTSAGSDDAFLARYSAAGDLIWARQFGGTGNESIRGIAIDVAGSVYTTGSFSGLCDFDPSASIYNIISSGLSVDGFVCKLNQNGVFQWAVRTGNSGLDTGHGIAIGADAGVYVGGSFNGTVDFDPSAGTHSISSAGSSDAYLLKLTLAGGFVWARGWGGASADACLAMATGSDGAVYAAGDFQGTVDFDPSAGVAAVASAGGADAFLSRFDGSGNLVWARTFGGAGTDQVLAAAVGGGGQVHVAGSFDATADFDPGAGVVNLTSAGGADAFVARLDAGGGLLWARSAGGAGADQATSVAVGPDDQLYIAGAFSDTVDFDPSPGARNLVSAGGSDAFMWQVTTGGDLGWARGMGGTGADSARGIAVAAGAAVLTGQFNGTADFDPASAAFNLSSAGGTDGFVVRLGVTRINQAPAGSVPPVGVLEDASPTAIDLRAVFSDDYDPVSVLSFSLASVSNSAPFSSVSLDSASGLLTLNYAANEYGSSTLVVRVTDYEGLSRDAAFSVDVTPVNDAPDFVAGGDVTVNAVGLWTFPGWANGMSAGPANEVGQSLSFSVTVEQAGLFETLPAVAADGTLTFQLRTAGTAVLQAWVTLSDNGGVAGGGVDQSAVRAFSITIAGNRAPVAQSDNYLAVRNRTLIVEGSGVLANDVDPDGNALAAVLVNGPRHGRLTLEEGGAFVYSPDKSFLGRDRFSYQATDGDDESNVTYVMIETKKHAFVRKRCYEDVLGRVATDDEIDYWLTRLENGASQDAIMKGFLESVEYWRRHVRSIYKELLGRSADAGGLNHWVERLRGGEREANLIAALTASDEYFRLQGGTAASYVSGLYRDLLGRSAGEVEVAWWQSFAGDNGSRYKVARSFAASDEFHRSLVDNPLAAANSWRGWYQDYLDRNADDSGRSYWLSQLRSGASWQYVQRQILASDENFME